MGMEFDLVERLGVTVVEVPGLDVDIAYIRRHRVALVREGLPAIGREKAADWVLGEATRQESWTPGSMS